jgi:hypothetical protein
MLGPWPPDRTIQPVQEEHPLTDAERIGHLEQTLINQRSYVTPVSEIHAVFSSKLGRLVNLKTSRW